MSDAPNRCEPPEHLRGVDGWHVVWSGKSLDPLQDNRPETLWWSAHTQDWAVFKGGARHPPEQWTELGYRYGGPAPDQSSAPVRSHEAVARLVEAAERMDALIPLLRLLTVRQVINAGDAAINAAGLNPWAINEGLARGDEAAVADWRLADFSAALAPFKEPT